MGSFLTNVQVRVEADNAVQVRRGIISSLREWMESAGYVEIPTAHALEHDRTLLVGPVTSHPWITVYDSASEGQDGVTLPELGAALSAVTGSVAVTILLHDSDTVELMTFESGTRRDESCYQVGRGGNVPAWRDLLQTDADIADLRALWTTPVTFAEQLIPRLAVLVGWCSEFAQAGYDTAKVSLSARCERLYFRRANLLGSDTSMTTHPLGIPRLEYVGGSESETEVKANEPVTLSVIAHNTGSASRGLMIAVWGDAVDKELLEPADAELRVTLGSPYKPKDVFHGRLNKTPAASGTIWLLELPDAAFPEGFADQAAAFAAAEGNAKEGLAKWLTTRIEASMVVRVRKPGQGLLHMGLIPTANPDAGQTSWTILLKIAG
jgi:hypothetical protein